MQDDFFTRHALAIKILGLTFVGLHVPLVCVGVARLGLGLTDANTLLMVTFAGTLAGALMTLPLLYLAMRPQDGTRA